MEHREGFQRREKIGHSRDITKSKSCLQIDQWIRRRLYKGGWQETYGRFLMECFCKDDQKKKSYLFFLLNFVGCNIKLKVGGKYT